MYKLEPGVDVLRRHPPGVCGEWLCAWLEVTGRTGEPQGDHMSLTDVVLSLRPLTGLNGCRDEP